jgi:hypothetical protein
MRIRVVLVMHAMCYDARAQVMVDFGNGTQKCCMRIRVSLFELRKLQQSMRDTYVSGLAGGIPAHRAAGEFHLDFRKYDQSIFSYNKKSFDNSIL